MPDEHRLKRRTLLTGAAALAAGALVKQTDGAAAADGPNALTVDGENCLILEQSNTTSEVTAWFSSADPGLSMFAPHRGIEVLTHGTGFHALASPGTLPPIAPTDVTSVLAQTDIGVGVHAHATTGTALKAEAADGVALDVAGRIARFDVVELRLVVTDGLTGDLVAELSVDPGAFSLRATSASDPASSSSLDLQAFSSSLQTPSMDFIVDQLNVRSRETFSSVFVIDALAAVPNVTTTGDWTFGGNVNIAGDLGVGGSFPGGGSVAAPLDLTLDSTTEPTLRVGNEAPGGVAFDLSDGAFDATPSTFSVDAGSIVTLSGSQFDGTFDSFAVSVPRSGGSAGLRFDSLPAPTLAVTLALLQADASTIRYRGNVVSVAADHFHVLSLDESDPVFRLDTQPEVALTVTGTVSLTGDSRFGPHVEVFGDGSEPFALDVVSDGGSGLQVVGTSSGLVSFGGASLPFVPLTTTVTAAVAGHGIGTALGGFFTSEAGVEALRVDGGMAVGGSLDVAGNLSTGSISFDTANIVGATSGQPALRVSHTDPGSSALLVPSGRIDLDGPLYAGGGSELSAPVQVTSTEAGVPALTAQNTAGGPALYVNGGTVCLPGTTLTAARRSRSVTITDERINATTALIVNILNEPGAQDQIAWLEVGDGVATVHFQRALVRDLQLRVLFLDEAP